jgi:gluconolactonase
VAASGGITGAGGNLNSGGSTGSGGVNNSGGSAGQATGGAGAAGSSGAGTGGNAALWTCPAGPFTSPNPSNITPTRIQGIPPSDSVDMYWGFGILEGPVWLNGQLYVSEIGGSGQPPSSRIFSISPSGTIAVVFPDSGSNGMAIDTMGRLIAADHKVGGIVTVDLANKSLTTLVGTYNGVRFDAPNDLTVRSDGTIYFSDTDYQAPSPQPQATRLYRLPPGSSTAVVVDMTRQDANGVTLSLDEKTLYVTDKQGIYKYAVNPDGSTGTATQIAQGTVTVGDGMGIDCAGNLYVASNSSIIVLSPSGTSLGSIDLGSSVQSVTNVAFGGADHKTLYITALGNVPNAPGNITGSAAGVFQAQMPLPGMPY